MKFKSRFPKAVATSIVISILFVLSVSLVNNPAQDISYRKFLKEFLDEKVIQFNNPAFIELDPVQIPHMYRENKIWKFPVSWQPAFPGGTGSLF